MEPALFVVVALRLALTRGVAGQCLWSVGFCDECPGVSIFAAVFVASLCPEDGADCGAQYGAEQL